MWINDAMLRHLFEKKKMTWWILVSLHYVWVRNDKYLDVYVLCYEQTDFLTKQKSQKIEKEKKNERKQ